MLALIYDVHGNLPALEAVLADAEGQGAERWLLGGDYVAWGAWPAESLERLRAIEGAQWIRGNTDRWLTDPPADPATAGALARAAEAIGAAAVSELVALPERLTLLEGHFCHASPLNDMESFGVEAQDGEDRLLDGVQTPRVVFGHPHVQFTRTRPDGIELVNPGSVGMPMDGDHRAAYALITPENVLQLRRVEYDHDAAAAQTRTFHGGHGEAADTYAGRIANAHL
jgi:diadenosine tetraphosphatase ApaH/serine/threonine PP2A family protein phosphatase